MKIDVSGLLAADGKTEKVNLSICLNDLSFNGNDLHFTEPIALCGTVKNEGGIIIAELNAKTKFKTLCARCLDDVDVDFSYDISERFVKNGAPDDAEVLEGSEIDADDVALRHLYMNLPISFVCKEDCKGLCQKCGKSLNDGECDCENDDIDPRMAALLNFKVNN